MIIKKKIKKNKKQKKNKDTAYAHHLQVWNNSQWLGWAVFLLQYHMDITTILRTDSGAQIGHLVTRKCNHSCWYRIWTALRHNSFL